MIHDSRVQRYINTVWCIADSQYVDQYVIGYTAGPIEVRFSTYKRQQYEHIVVLSNAMTQSQALWLEQRLQEKIKETDKRSVLWRKYHHDRRLKRYFKSAGPGSPAPLNLIHSVYMVWWEPWR